MLNPQTGLPVAAGSRYLLQDRIFWDTGRVPAGAGNQVLPFFQVAKNDYQGNLPAPGSFGATVAFSARAIQVTLQAFYRGAFVVADADMMADVIYGGMLAFGQDVSVEAFSMPLASILTPMTVAGVNTNAGVLQNTMGMKVLNEPLVFSGGSITTMLRLNLAADASGVWVMVGLHGFFGSNPRQ